MSISVVRIFYLFDSVRFFHKYSIFTNFNRSQAESGWNSVPSWLCLETAIKNLHETYQRRMHSGELLMMGKEDARNM
jgi:hypothetical protein